MAQARKVPAERSAGLQECRTHVIDLSTYQSERVPGENSAKELLGRSPNHTATLQVYLTTRVFDMFLDKLMAVELGGREKRQNPRSSVLARRAAAMATSAWAVACSPAALFGFRLRQEKPTASAGR